MKRLVKKSHAQDSNPRPQRHSSQSVMRGNRTLDHDVSAEDVERGNYERVNEDDPDESMDKDQEVHDATESEMC